MEYNSNIRHFRAIFDLIPSITVLIYFIPPVYAIVLKENIIYYKNIFFFVFLFGFFHAPRLKSRGFELLWVGRSAANEK